MAQKEREFNCVIEDPQLNDRFSAVVTVSKKRVIEATRQKDGKLELAHVFITPVSDQLKSVHNHFVLYDHMGNGLYIVRDRYGTEVHRRQCRTWDLGTSFATKVADALKTL